MPRLTPEQRGRALGMKDMGASNVLIARTFGCHRKTIENLMKRYRDTGTTLDRSRTGRPRVTSRREDRYLRTLHLRNRFLTVAESASTALGRVLSQSTVRRRLRAAGIRARRPYCGPTLTRQHRHNRLIWTRRVRRWQLRDWRNVMFTDESRFCLYKHDGRARVYRRQGERNAPNCVAEVQAHGGGSVMVWGGIRGENKSPLVIVMGNMTAQRYIDQVLRPVVLPFLQNHPGTLFQHDNAPAHSARAVSTFLDNNNVNVLPWPSRSPDLSPIEHMWDCLGRRIRNRANPPVNLRQLEQALQDEWGNIPNATVRRLTTSMRRRVFACITAEGGHTKY